MSERISITEAAKRLGISRPRLSALIDENQVKKIPEGKQMLVDLSEVQSMMQMLASTQKLRTPKPTKKPDAEDALVTHLKEEVKRLTLERNEIYEKYRAAESAQTELKLLKASKEEIDRNLEQERVAKAKLEKSLDEMREEYQKSEEDYQGRIDALMNKLETLESEASEAKKLRQEIASVKQRMESTLIGKAAKIRDVILGK
jgi:excisionase family DNA binding protein